MLDLSKTNYAEVADAGFEFELKLPTGEPTGAFITVRGDESKTVKAYRRKKFNEFEAKRIAAKRRGKDMDDITLEEAEELAVEAAVVRIIKWRGITDAGDEVKFSEETAKKILKEHTWIREQVMEEAGQLLNFRPE